MSVTKIFCKQIKEFRDIEFTEEHGFRFRILTNRDILFPPGNYKISEKQICDESLKRLKEQYALMKKNEKEKAC